MNFYDRYSLIARERGLDACSQKAADLFGITRATISVWGSKGTTPKGETVAKIADVLHVSADYLLGRTDDPTDYVNEGRQDQASLSSSVVEHIQIADKPDDTLALLIDRLDQADRLRVEGVIQGMLMHEKYMHGGD